MNKIFSAFVLIFVITFSLYPTYSGRFGFFTPILIITLVLDVLFIIFWSVLHDDIKRGERFDTSFGLVVIFLFFIVFSTCIRLHVSIFDKFPDFFGLLSISVLVGLLLAGMSYLSCKPYKVNKKFTLFSPLTFLPDILLIGIFALLLRKIDINFSSLTASIILLLMSLTSSFYLKKLALNSKGKDWINFSMIYIGLFSMFLGATSTFIPIENVKEYQILCVCIAMNLTCVWMLVFGWITSKSKFDGLSFRSRKERVEMIINEARSNIKKF